MNSFFKRSAISLVVLGMAGASHAAMSNNTMWGPQFTGVFIGVEGLNLRPQNGDLDYVTSFSSVLVNPVINTGAISTSYDWGWRVYGGINFTDNDDLTLSWMQLDTSDSRSLTTLVNTTYVPRWLFDGDWSGGIAAKVKFRLDEAYLVWGHTIHFNNPWSIRFAGGVEYAKIDSDMFVSASDAPLFSVPFDLGFESKSHAQGWGPRIEFDASYQFPYGFNWFARTNAALLSSTRKISLIASDNDFDIGPTTLSASFSTRNIIIPKVGMKIGLGFSYLFGQAGAEGTCGTLLTLEAGWQADAYIHAIERPLVGPIESDGFNITAMSETKTSNFTDQGVFVGLKVSTSWL